ncbi:multidrug transporter [Marinobacter salinus]|uniref:Multidrug transporter n=1 Tax=Marinobacter salinus TaxID=1874317 RepID=A0A1D9GJ98_9GAMM|nr:multidrug transporter [Marinobacter salinus]AOY87604.1 multidrug transporter [Marinobacter salinus]
MSHLLATIVLATLGAILVVAGLLFFLRPRWLLDWLKGMAILGAILFGLYTLVIAVNIAEYQSVEGMQTVAAISTERQGDQFWRVTMHPANAKPVTNSLRGDQWQVDARIIRFSGPLSWLGVAPGYRLERLSGRFTTLEQERAETRLAIDLNGKSWLDLWELDRKFDLPFIEAVHRNVTFMPMRDGAMFDVRLSASGLVAVPVNEEAREAVQLWGQ